MVSDGSLCPKQIKVQEEIYMNESELYKELGILTKDNSKWEKNLQEMAETDSNRVVRIHSLGAIKATTAK